MSEKRYPLVVIGAGGGGLTAACRAAEMGVSPVLVLEKRPYHGGNSGMAGGWIFGVESDILKAAGSTDSKAVMAALPGVTLTGGGRYETGTEITLTAPTAKTKEAAVVTKTPTEKTLTYNGQAQELVEEGRPYFRPNSPSRANF